MSEPLSPSQGWGVLHLFCQVQPAVDAQAVRLAVKAAEGAGLAVVPVSVFGHKADIGFVALGPDWVPLRRFQRDIQTAGLTICYSYVSLTEVSEYARAAASEHAAAYFDARLHPKLPPAGKRAFCFYPMSKRRQEHANWYELEFEERKRLMGDHGRSGRRFTGRVVQLVTGSTGLDDYEWGVTLFAERPDDLKETVYTMRFDEASARYAEFGPFYTGIVGSLDEILAEIGADPSAPVVTGEVEA